MASDALVFLPRVAYYLTMRACLLARQAPPWERVSKHPSEPSKCGFGLVGRVLGQVSLRIAFPLNTQRKRRFSPAILTPHASHSRNPYTNSERYAA